MPYGVDARRSVSGRDVGRAGRARTRAWRLHQRPHQERDECGPRRSLRLFSRRPVQRTECPDTGDAADEPEAVRRQPGRSNRAGSDVLLRRTPSSAGWIRLVWSRSHRTASTPSTRGYRVRAIQAPMSQPASIPTRCARRMRSARSTTSSTAATRSASVTACADVASDNSRGAGGLNAPSASAGLDNIDQTIAFSNTHDALADDRERDARAGLARRSAKRRRPIRLDRRSASPGVASFGTLSEQSDASCEHVVRNRQQPVAPGRRARAARRRRRPLQRRHDHLSAIDSRRYTFSSLAEFPVAAPTTTPASRRRSATTVGVADQSERRRSTRRTSGRSARSLTLNAGHALRPAVPRDASRPTRNNVVAARRLRLVAVRVAAHGRARQRQASSTIACRCGRWRTRCCRPATRPTSANLRQISISLSPAQAGAPAFPNILARARAVGDARSTSRRWTAHMQERVLAAGERRGRAAARRAHARSASPTSTARRRPDHLGEPERAVVRRGRHQQRLPSQPDLREQQPVLAAWPDRPITACTCRSFSGRRSWGSYRVSYSLSKSMNNVGENFFSSPIDPFDIDEGLGPIRRRPAASAGAERIGQLADDARAQPLGADQHGFQVSSMLQAYSALPFNITSGRDDRPGHGGPADRRRRVHRTQYRRLEATSSR